MGNEKQALLQAISAYVPDLIVRQVVTAPHVPLAGREERLNAALLFADVSGFTAMSESLAQLGRHGGEELTNVLNGYFTAMIDLVRSYGGQIIKFGGDAITCAFVQKLGFSGKQTDKTGFLLSIQRACACALAMQKEMSGFRAVETKGGIFELQMKIGISAGSVLFFSGLGNQQEGLEYVLAGHPLDRMAEAEHHAVAGEVVVDGECVSDVGVDWREIGIIVSQDREGFLLVEGLAQAIKEVNEEEVNWDALYKETTDQVKASDAVIAQLVSYLPPRVYENIVEGQRQFVGELRPVASLFVNFYGLDYDGDPDVGKKLQQYFATMQEIIHRYGGRLNRVITGDKGSLLHLIFGAPVANDNDQVLAVGCALAMQQSAARLKSATDGQPFIMDQQIGIASGYVFAGNVGSERRREYTVMGDVVNLSARLMQAADMWEILIDQTTARRAENEFISEELTPIRVKGKQEPISIYRPVGARSETKVWGRRDSPIFGREQELLEAAEIVEQAMAGHGQLLVITGDAGVGKSRLLEEVIALAYEKGETAGNGEGTYGLRGDCLSYGSQSPYLPWIDLFTSFFGLSTGIGESVEAKIHRIEQRMAEADPTLRDWVPLIGQLLGLPVTDNQLTISLDAQLRKQRTFDITLTLLRNQAQQVPLLLVVFEDVHWIDSISLEMLNYVARNIAGHRILLVVPHRPTIELKEWTRYDYYNYIELVDLSAEDALKLAEYKFGGEASASMHDQVLRVLALVLGIAIGLEAPASLRDQVLRGEERINPFFVEELINSLIDREYLIPREDGSGYELVGDLSQVEIPDSVQALVMSRIDRLDESSNLTVKISSVIGRTFAYRTLWRIYPIEIISGKLQENLEKLSSLDLTPLDKPEPELEYIFKHATTQEVAYKSLLYAHRRELHRRVGEYLERAHADNLEEYYELLALHYYQSGSQAKSWDYLVKAGDKAKDKYANESAIAYYSQALTIDWDSECERENTHCVYEALGDVYRHIGQYEMALKSYREALDCQLPTTVQVAEVQRKIAKTWELQGRYDEAMQYLDLARTALGEGQEVPEMARIYGDMGWAAMRQGEYKEALRQCTKGLEIADKLPHDEKSHRVKALLEYNLGTIYWQIGEYPQALLHLQTCIEMHRNTGNLYRMSGAYNNLAAVYLSQNDHDLSAQYFRKSLEITQRIGETYGTAMCYNNLGVVYYSLGNYPQAVDHYEKSLEIRQEIGDLLGIADTHLNLGEVYQSLGNYQQALYHLEDAVDLFTEIGDKIALVEVFKLLAQVKLELSSMNDALEYGQLFLNLAQEVESQDDEGIAYRVLGQIHRAAGRSKDANQHLQSSVEILTTIGNKLELGKSCYELGIILSAIELEEGFAQLQRAVQIFEELGMEGELGKAREALVGRSSSINGKSET
ncbi:MAG: tetratricopeptide repeat protein [Proteobacteria bacterium]|nr:tetratricopeptide repeat protein [Pseudomonadota bacterium]